MQKNQQQATQQPPAKSTTPTDTDLPQGEAMPVEIGGPKGPEPTRFGDWERSGRCSDF